jgi:hypothetical protein
MTRARRSFVLTSAIATVVVGLVGIPAAHADTSITVTPTSGLADPQDITIQLAGFALDPFASLQVAECGNAYANLDPLPARPNVTPGVLNSRDCEPIGFLSQGTLTSSPVTVAGLTAADPTVHQTGIGTGNRSCITAPGVAPCFVYLSTSVNLPPFPATDITFANAFPAGSEPAATATTVAPIGSPVALGKTAHALVHVTTSDPSLRPDGSVQVFEGETLLGTADLDNNAYANIAIGVPTLVPHDLTAEYSGNGSFAPSATPTPATLSIVGVNNISIGDASIIEGDAPVLRSIVFPVVLSKPSATPVLVNYSVVATGANPATIGLSKTPGTQVVAQAKTLTFRPVLSTGVTGTVRYVTVRIYGDTNDDGDHTFAVQLALNPLDTSGYVLRRPTGNGLIIGDDAPTASAPVVSIGTASVPEGDVGGAKALKVSVTMSRSSLVTVTVPVVVAAGTAVHGTKLNGDWGGGVLRKVVFRAGQVSKIVAVSAFPDTNDELDKTVNLTLGTPLTTDATVSLGSNDTAVGTILSDE